MSGVALPFSATFAVHLLALAAAMTTHHFVLTYTGEEAMPDEDVARFNEQTLVLDHSRHGLLVEDSSAHLKQLLLTMPQWKIGPERMHKRLETLIIR